MVDGVWCAQRARACVARSMKMPQADMSLLKADPPRSHFCSASARSGT